MQQATYLHKTGDLPRAITLYKELLEADPSQADVWHLKGMAEHQVGNFEAALASAERAISLGGMKVSYLMLQGGVLHDQGELERAEERLTLAAKTSPDWAPALVDLGSVRLDRGNAEGAVLAFRAAVAADPKSERGWNNLGVALQALDKFDDAERAFNYLLTLNPGSAQAHFNLAGVKKLRNDVKLALQHAEIAVRHDPKHAEAWLLVGDLKRRMREGDAALAAFRSAAATPWRSCWRRWDASTRRAAATGSCGSASPATCARRSARTCCCRRSTPRPTT
jgi:tetratricopeptide (TPR) repeat protein